MTTFQLAALGLLLVALVINYGLVLKNLLLSLLGRINLQPARSVATPVAQVPPVTAPSTAYTVNDLVTVTALRDRLAAIGCVEGVDACKMLIRIMIEFKLS